MNDPSVDNAMDHLDIKTLPSIVQELTQWSKESKMFSQSLVTQMLALKNEFDLAHRSNMAKMREFEKSIKDMDGRICEQGRTITRMDLQIQKCEQIHEKVNEINKRVQSMDGKVKVLDTSMSDAQKILENFEKVQNKSEQAVTTVNRVNHRVETLEQFHEQAQSNLRDLTDWADLSRSNFKKLHSDIDGEQSHRSKFQELMTFEMEVVRSDLRSYAFLLGGFGDTKSFLGNVVNFDRKGIIDEHERKLIGLAGNVRTIKHSLDELSKQQEESQLSYKNQEEINRKIESSNHKDHVREVRQRLESDILSTEKRILAQLDAKAVEIESKFKSAAAAGTGPGKGSRGSASDNAGLAEANQTLKKSIDDLKMREASFQFELSTLKTLVEELKAKVEALHHTGANEGEAKGHVDPNIADGSGLAMRREIYTAVNDSSPGLGQEGQEDAFADGAGNIHNDQTEGHVTDGPGAVGSKGQVEDTEPRSIRKSTKPKRLEEASNQEGAAHLQWASKDSPLRDSLKMKIVVAKPGTSSSPAARTGKQQTVGAISRLKSSPSDDDGAMEELDAVFKEQVKQGSFGGTVVESKGQQRNRRDERSEALNFLDDDQESNVQPSKGRKEKGKVEVSDAPTMQSFVLLYHEVAEMRAALDSISSGKGQIGRGTTTAVRKSKRNPFDWDNPSLQLQVTLPDGTERDGLVADSCELLANPSVDPFTRDALYMLSKELGMLRREVRAIQLTQSSDPALAAAQTARDDSKAARLQMEMMEEEFFKIKRVILADKKASSEEIDMLRKDYIDRMRRMREEMIGDKESSLSTTHKVLLTDIDSLQARLSKVSNDHALLDKVVKTRLTEISSLAEHRTLCVEQLVQRLDCLECSSVTYEKDRKRYEHRAEAQRVAVFNYDLPSLEYGEYKKADTSLSKNITAAPHTSPKSGYVMDVSESPWVPILSSGGRSPSTAVSETHNTALRPRSAIIQGNRVTPQRDAWSVADPIFTSTSTGERSANSSARPQPGRPQASSPRPPSAKTQGNASQREADPLSTGIFTRARSTGSARPQSGIRPPLASSPRGQLHQLTEPVLHVTSKRRPTPPALPLGPPAGIVGVGTGDHQGNKNF